MIKISTAFAALLIAAAGFASVTYAEGQHNEGEYYEGVQKNALGQTHPTVSHEYTGSVSHAGRMDDHGFGRNSIDSGDYYEGASRPN
jgi:hypothetical protein